MFPGNVVRFDTLSNTYDIKYCDGWEELGVASNHVMARVLPSVQEKRAATMAAKAAAAAAKKAAAEGTAWHAAPPHPRVRREVYVGDAYREAHRRARRGARRGKLTRHPFRRRDNLSASCLDLRLRGMEHVPLQLL